MGLSVENGTEPLPGLSGWFKYRGLLLECRIKWARATPDSEGQYPAISKQETKQRDNAQREVLRRNQFWAKEMDRYVCNPTDQSSPIHFCDPRHSEVSQALPYHVVAPMSYEYPYWAGQAQKTVMSCLLIANHYGFQVVHPGYVCSEDGSVSEAQAQESIQCGEALDDFMLDTEVRKAYRPRGLLSVGYNDQRTFTCREDSCRVVGGGG